ncbi:sulfite exporter TauE/SafE family protein [Jannaschia seohaensis]|uniref:Probable membrane transporter protein n=1 Tax=Jannaschia seohaensis TaxID=475081 RepID=A0A2Y9B8Y5_9RHOB|nr:sulfite exporter TauE/SafE family protein [Jannaschia seohaensis]PWJ11166.1 hypothetical protein BCF38_12010 [Jannaschia seohaensis]SSA51467.1 hypothetical protein SAMN05421539_12010 [Jannaschia seohaensis]
MDAAVAALSGAVASPGIYLLTFATIMAAGVVQSSAGIGFGLVAAPALMFLNPALVPGGVIFLGILVSALSSLRDLRHVQRRYVVAGLAGRAPAALLAAFFVAGASAATFEALFALSILLAVGLSVLAPRFRPTVPRVAAAGIVSGLMGTLTGVGAPPFAIALQNAPSGELRATMNAVLMFGAILSIAALAAFGAFGWADILRGLSLIPAALAGFWLARFVIRDPRAAAWLRPAILTLCVASSVALLLRAGLLR